MAVPDIDTATLIGPEVGTTTPPGHLPSAEDLPYEDGIPLESTWHRLQMNLLIEVLGIAWHERTDFFVGGNMFIYYSPNKLKSEDVHGPDFFVVIGEDVDKHRSRLSWVMWEENDRLPNYILELVLPSTRRMDEVVKKQRYQDMFRTPEYVLYYPQQRRIVGWRLDANGRYQTVPTDAHGWLWSEELHLWLGLWDGYSHNGEYNTWLRFFDEERRMLPSGREQAAVARQQVEQERQAREQAEERIRALEEEVRRLRETAR